jgi:hypothetical protein
VRGLGPRERGESDFEKVTRARRDREKSILHRIARPSLVALSPIATKRVNLQ